MKSEPTRYDYGDVRASLKDAIKELEAARKAAGRTNLYPTMTPADARRQIDDVDEMLRAAAEELSAAREACATIARRGLTAVG
ncbi:MAG: hypothetical protein AAFN79_09995 [Pseudomonadota bacterium]